MNLSCVYAEMYVRACESTLCEEAHTNIDKKNNNNRKQIYIKTQPTFTLCRSLKQAKDKTSLIVAMKQINVTGESH